MGRRTPLGCCRCGLRLPLSHSPFTVTRTSGVHGLIRVAPIYSHRRWSLVGGCRALWTGALAAVVVAKEHVIPTVQMLLQRRVYPELSTRSA